MNTKLVNLYICLLLLALSSCSVIQKSSVDEIPEGIYRVQLHQTAVIKDTTKRIPEWTKVYLINDNDSIKGYALDTTKYHSEPFLLYPAMHVGKGVSLIQTSFDFDVFTTPFKYRAPIAGFPRQFNADFNGSVFLGYRIDKLTINQKTLFKDVKRDQFKKRGFGIGGFAGLSTVFISPAFMNNTIDYEYDGLGIDYGIAALFGFRKFNTGLSLGNDLLIDANAKNWVYHNKPWIGIFIGFNLN
ncbi:MAG: hypothetical protein K2P88_00450 [Chitinophagaceae bacterium]|jgi:hypothetical protein|uniref:hypothetical protein n=1 Tax=unclassified Paraflavitalea TaxID=2798305 RepID=UPI003D351707|nr:hypothetical protein [Chitinophagaceae bacterium]